MRGKTRASSAPGPLAEFSGADASPQLAARAAAGGPLAVIGALDLAVVLGHGGLRDQGAGRRSDLPRARAPRGRDSSGAPPLSQPAFPRTALAGALLIALLLGGAPRVRAQDSQPPPAEGEQDAAAAQGADAEQDEAAPQDSQQDAAPSDEAGDAANAAAPRTPTKTKKFKKPKLGSSRSKPAASAEPEAEAEAGEGGAGAEADDVAPVADAPGGGEAAVASAAARSFAETLKRSIMLELQVQQYELSTLGQEDPATLEGWRKTRRLRIEKDKDFKSVQGQLSMSAMAPPDAADATNVSREARAVFAQLGRSYEASRDVKPLQQYMENNQQFLKSGDWAARDRAAQYRDDLLAREIGYTTLMRQAQQVLEGTAPDGTVEQMRDTLHTIAPESSGPQDDLATLVIHDEALRTEVFGELTSMLTAPGEPDVPPRSADELTPLVNNLQLELLQKAGLEGIVAEHAHVMEGMDKVDTALEANPLPELVSRKADLVARRDDLELRWFTTQPDPETFEALVEAQDELARRLMLDLGPPGVLFGARLKDVEAYQSRAAKDTLFKWKLLEQQRDMLTSLDAARPAVDPLAGLKPPDSLVKMKLGPTPEQLAAAAKGKVKPKAIGKPTPHKKPAHKAPAHKPKPKPKGGKHKAYPGMPY